MDYIVKELPITFDIEFTVDFGHALPLCILNSREQFKNWLLQKLFFIQTLTSSTAW